MKAKIRSKILEIQYLAILCGEIDYHCFVDYQAHVNKISVRLYNGKWSSSKDPISTNIKTGRFDDNDDIKINLDICNKVIYQLKSILKKNKIDYSTLYKVERIEFDYVF